MLSKTVVFLVILLFTFTALIAFIPIEFRSVGLASQFPEVQTQLNANDLIVYNNQGSDTMVAEYSSLTDAPAPPQWNASLPTGHYLEVWWGPEYLWGFNFIEVRHVSSQFWGWRIEEYCTFYFKNGTKASVGITVSAGAVVPILPKESLIQAWDPATNSSSFTVKSKDISISIYFEPAIGYDDIGESFDAGTLDYGLSYEWDTTLTGFTILTFVTQVLSFQGLDIGIPGFFGSFIANLLAIFVWITLAFVVYKIFAGLIPFLSGGSGD